MHQANMGRIGKTAPTVTSDEPMRMFKCCVSILDWQKTQNPGVVQIHIPAISV